MKVTVIGGGAWGTALAAAVVRAGHDVMLWARDEQIVEEIQKNATNHKYLGPVFLPKGVQATTDFIQALHDTDAVLMAIPAQQMRSVLHLMADHMPIVPIAICAKGIEKSTQALMSKLVSEELPTHPIAVLSGPTFATEVAAGKPTAITLACQQPKYAKILVKALGSSVFRPYLSADLIGVQIAGIVKNILAIACGIIMGRNLGENARAALITRGLHEMALLISARGGATKTVQSLSGLGDLMLTCTSLQSRNTSFGYALGQGQDLDQLLTTPTKLAEGVWSIATMRQIAEADGLEMPIITAVDAIISHHADIDTTIVKLLGRPFREE